MRGMVRDQLEQGKFTAHLRSNIPLLSHLLLQFLPFYSCVAGVLNANVKVLYPVPSRHSCGNEFSLLTFVSYFLTSLPGVRDPPLVFRDNPRGTWPAAPVCGEPDALPA